MVASFFYGDSVAGRQCTICTSRHRGEIDKLLALKKMSMRAIGRKYGYHEQTVRNHKHKHLEPILDQVTQEAELDEIKEERKKLDVKSVSGLEDVISNWDFIQEKVEDIINKTVNPKDKLTAIRELRNLQSDIVSGMARVAELKQKRVPLGDIPEWQEMKELLTEVITDCPRCRGMLWAAINGVTVDEPVTA